jgi:hypothetical protein
VKEEFVLEKDFMELEIVVSLIMSGVSIKDLEF